MGELQAWFRTDGDCLDYLEWLRWPRGFVCPSCGHIGGWRLGDGRFKCPECDARTSVTAGTIFDRTRTPLTVWFAACWLFATGKNGISALSLKLQWRSVPTRPRGRCCTGYGQSWCGRDGIAYPARWRWMRGISEARSPAGRGSRPRQEGPCRHCGRNKRSERNRPMSDAAAGRFIFRLTALLRDGPCRVGHQGCHRWLGWLPRAGQAGLCTRTAQSACRSGPWGGWAPAAPAVHRVASLAKRWLLGTHQGSADRADLLPTSISSCFGSIAEARAAAGCCLSSP